MVINQMRRLQLLWKMYYKVNFLTPVRGTALRDVYLERIFQRIIISRKGDGSNTAWLLCFFHFVYDFKVPTRYRVVIHLVQVIQWKNERTLVKRKGQLNNNMTNSLRNRCVPDKLAIIIVNHCTLSRKFICLLCGFFVYRNLRGVTRF